MKLRPYQEEGVDYIVSRKRSALFWEPRTGKSPTSIVASVEVADPEKTLVIAPASIIHNWIQEWKTWGTKKVPLFLSYHWLQKPENAAKLSRIFWDLIIVDEAHALKSWESARTKHFLAKIECEDEEYSPLYRRTKRSILLTGTPSTRSAEDYHSILSMLAPGKLGKLGDWKERHCKKKIVGAGRYKREVWYGYKDEERINRLVHKYASVKRYSEVVKYMPKVQHSRFYVDVSADMPEEIIEEDLIENGGPPESILPRLRQLGLDKAEACIEWLEEFREPVVIFCWFRDTVEYLKTNLKDVIGTVTGKDSHVAKANNIGKFRQARGRAFILCNIAAGSLGIDLSNADCAVFIELPYSSADFDQACARIRRPEKTRPTEIISVIAEDSYDDRLLKILREKAVGQGRCLR